MRVALYAGIILLVTIIAAAGAHLLLREKMPPAEAAFHYAGRMEHGKLENLLDRRPELLEKKDSWGRTLLHDAATRADAPLAALLLERGAAVNPLDRQGKTPLDLAREELARAKQDGYCQAAVKDTLRILLDHGAEPSASSDETGETPGKTGKGGTPGKAGHGRAPGGG